VVVEPTPSRLSVALVCPYDLSVPGGVQYQVLALAEALSALGTCVTVVAPGEPEQPRWAGDQPAPPPFDLVNLGRSLAVPVNGSRAPVALSPRSAARTARCLRGRRFDAVHVHEPMTPLVGLASLLAAQAPLVATFHRAGLDPLYRAEGLALRPLARRIRTAVAVSEAARATAQAALGLEEVAVVPNGVRLTPGRPLSRGREGHDRPTVVFFSRHEERKGLAVLLEAFAAVPPPARLVVMSDGPLTADLRARHPSSDRLEWIGRVSAEEKDAVLASADIACAPSLGGESFGVVLLEAMAAGAAVVASDLPGYRLAAGEAARLVPPGDPAALAAALTELLTDEAARLRLAEAGLRRAEEHDISRVAARYLELYAAAAS